MKFFPFTVISVVAVGLGIYGWLLGFAFTAGDKVYLDESELEVTLTNSYYVRGGLIGFAISLYFMLR